MKMYSISLTLVLFFTVLASSVIAQSTPAGYNTTGALSLESQVTSPAGQTDFQTDPFTGRFEYTVPLEVAPARHDSGMNLELVYNSANGNSWCGVGWDLDLGYIERESKYGVPIQWSGGKPVSPMAYDDTKGFYFSFKNKTSDLVNVTDGTWRAKVQSDFLQFQYYSSTNTWIVIDKSGNEYIFGSSSNSRMSNPKSGWSQSGDANTWHWALDTIITPTGDTATITYTSAGGRLYPQYYKYNGHTAGLSPLCVIQFYLTSTNRTDTSLSCRAGYVVTNQYLLNAISHTVNGQLVWSNKLNYTISSSTDRSLLTSITRYGTDGSSTLPVLSFNYSQQSYSFKSPVHWTNLYIPPGGSNSYAYYYSFNNAYADLVDLDGDGFPDRIIAPISTPSTNWWVQHNNGSNGFSNPTIWTVGTQANSQYNTSSDPTWAQFASHGRVVDFNGDGWPDFIVDPLEMFTGGGYTRQVVQLNNSTNLLGQFSWTNVIDQYNNPYGTTSGYRAVEDLTAGQAAQVVMLDMNGDGLPDRVMTLPGGTFNYYLVQFNTGNGYTGTNAFGPYSSQGYSTDINWAGLTGNLGYNPETGGAASSMRMLDINGDGLPDRVMLVHASNSSGAAPAQNQTYLVVELNNGYGFEPAINWTNVIPYYGTNCGGGTTSGIQDLGDDAQVAYRDVNGDGLPDRIIACQCPYYGSTDVGYTNWFVQINTGTGFGPLINWGPTSSQGQTGLPNYCGIQSSASGTGITMLLDMNGDGLPDRIEYVYNSTLNSNFYIVELSSGPFPDLMTVASNGLGGVVTATYKPSTQYDNRETTNSTTSRYLLPLPIYTVSSVSVSDGIYPSNTTTYSYTGGFWNFSLHQFNGFAQCTVVDPLGMTTVHWFHQAGGRNNSSFGEYQDSSTAIGKVGMEYRTDLYGSDAQPYRMRLNEINETVLNSVEHYAHLDQTIDVEYPASSSGYYRAAAKQYAYDMNYGNLTNETDLGQVTNVVVNGQSFSDVTGDTIYRITKFASLSNPNIVNKPQQITLYDNTGVNILREQTNGYDGSTGNLLGEGNLICPGGSYRTTSYGYDSTYHNEISRTDPDSVTTQTTYESTFETFPTQIKQGGTFTTSTTYDPRSGKLYLSISPQGLVTSNRYDAFLRLAETDASSISNGPTSWVEKYSYTLGVSSGVPQNSVLRQQSDGVDASNGHQTMTWYDGLGRTIQLRKESETSGTYRVVDTVYDQRGNVGFTSLPYENGAGTSHSTPASGLGTLRSYDPIGRPIALTGAVSGSFNGSGLLTGTSATSGDSGSPVAPSGINYFYNGDPWTLGVTNENRKIHEYVLDAYGRTNKVIEVTSGGNFTTTFSNNLAGDLLSVTDNANNVIQYSNNLVGEVVALADPDMGVWLYQRDYAGRIRGQIDGDNQRITNNYSPDPLGRLLSRQVYDLKGNFYYGVTNIYDSNGGDANFPVYPGQLYMTIDSEGYTKYGYDVRGRKIITARYLSKNGMTYTNRYNYDDMDRVRSIVYPNNGPTVSNIYDTGANLYEVQQIGGANTAYYKATSFTALDQIAGITYGNGLTATYSYYSNSKRLQTLTTSGGLQSLSYTYDQMADILSISDSAYSGNASAGISANASYDDLQRLLGFTRANGQSVSCTYDSVGNILTYSENGSASYTYTTTSGTHLPHAVKSANGLNYAYDTCGNMLVRGTQALAYNPENRLIVSAVSNQVTTFGYDAEGHRLWKQGSPTNTLQVWIENNYEEKDGKILFHIMAADRVVCTYSSDGSVFEYYHPDHLHSAEVLSTTSGGLYQHYEYAAYGNSRYVYSATAFPITRRYSSQSFDEETGLYYFGGRYYDPVIGRFIQPDPAIPSIFNPQAYDRYAYCYDNPLKYFDPDGHAGYWADVGQVWLGYYDSGASFVRGSVFAVAHPITTVEGVGSAIAHLPTTVESIGNAVGQEWNSGLRGQGDVVGSVLIATGTALAPGAEASTVSKVGQAASAGSKAEEVGTAVQTAAKEGGAYKDLGAGGMERHHMPANSVSPLSREKGPAIRMEPEEHAKTASFGSSKEAKAYRAKQGELIKKGNFKEAQEMDVKDVQSKFGNKYDAAIKQAQDYTDTIPEEELQPEPTPQEDVNE